MALKAVLVIGSVDFSRYVAKNGMSWDRIRVNGSVTRTLDGTAHISGTEKVKLDVSLAEISTETLTALNAALATDYFPVRYLDPVLGITEKTFFLSSHKTSTKVVEDGRTYWADTKFSLEEQ